MDRKEIVLDNGTKLVMINTDKFKTVTVNLFFEDISNDFNITCDIIKQLYVFIFFFAF